MTVFPKGENDCRRTLTSRQYPMKWLTPYAHTRNPFPNKKAFLPYVSGIVLLGLHLALDLLSSEFVYGRALDQKPIVTMVIIEIVAGTVFIAAVWAIRSMRDNSATAAWIILVGALLRIIMFHSTPILEDDFYRYLWDGAVSARGTSPYAYAPSEVQGASESAPDALRSLARESGNVIARVNHPDLRTIYPPAAQSVFALAYLLGPWSLTAWRLVLALFDVLTVILLFAVLKNLKLSYLSIIIYWWNPVVIKEIFNSAHMDTIAIPFTLAALLFACRNRELLAAALTAGAGAVKIWPIVLVPVILSPLWRKPRRLFISLCVFVCLSLILYIPVIAAGLDSRSGFTAYGKTWEMNDALYMGMLWGVQYVLSTLSWGGGVDHLITRGAISLILAGWIAWVCRTVPEQAIDLWDRALFIVAAVFLLSPTQFPWYYVWLVPFLVIRPRYSLLILSALLPLYYLRFYFRAHDKGEFFDNYVVWFEYVPVWVMLGREWMIARQSVRES